MIEKEEKLTKTQRDICKVYSSHCQLLIEKNKRYGNSALQPANIFSKLSAEDSIKIRLDDKLKRIMNSEELRKNDVADIFGYLVLMCVNRGWLNFEDLID